MSRAKFILKEPKSKKDTLVYLTYNYDYHRFKYSTKEKIDPKFWNQKEHRAKESKQFSEHQEFNTKLDNIQHAINNIFRKLHNDGMEINNQILKKHLDSLLNGIPINTKKQTFIEFCEVYIKECENNRRESTLKDYEIVLKYLKQYNLKHKYIDFKNIDLAFYNDYLAFLSNEKSLSINTIGKHIKTIKSFLNEATERGLNENLEFRKKKFKTVSEDSDSIYLNIKEVEKIKDLDLSKNPKLDKTRDLFLIGCYTGLRFSDFTHINPENINLENSTVIKRTLKTGAKVIIPLHRIVKEIIVKYDSKLPKSSSNQTMNERLRKIAKLAGIKDLIEITIKKHNLIEKTTHFKYELISSHTARRSFATNLYLADVPVISIMKMTGHKTERSFMKYIKISQQENADKLMEHPFFN